MLELYHHGSSTCAAKVRFALGEKRLEWASHYIDILKGEQFQPQFLAINPKAVVPVLIHNDFIVRESTVICEYIEDAFSEYPIYPKSAIERARVRVWTKAVDEELHPACSAVTYIVSHRHTILRNGVGNFEDFLKQGVTEGKAARALKWQWIQDGIEAPSAAEQVKLYDGYLHRMQAALGGSPWLAGEQFTMADIAMAPYLNRLSALSMSGLWEGGRLPLVENWFSRIRERPTFGPAFTDWMPADLTSEMRINGQKSWPLIKRMLETKPAEAADGKNAIAPG